MHACYDYITVKKTACVDTFSKKNDSDKFLPKSGWVRVSVISIITSYNMENTGLIVQQIIVWRFAVCPGVLTLYIVVHCET